jgi:hypothetical protein
LVFASVGECPFDFSILGELIDMRTAIFTGLAFGLLAISQAHAIVIQPNESASKDTFAYEFLSTFNFNTTPGFTTYLGSGKTGTGHDIQTLLQFNLASVPYSASQVTSAVLSVYAVDATISGGGPGFGANPTTTVGESVQHNVRPLDATWVEDTVTWGTKPAAGAIEATATQTGIGTWINFDITNLVKAWLDNSVTNNGLLIEQNAVVLNGANQKIVGVFSSSAGAFAPTLTVVPEPASVALALFAAASVVGLVRRARRKSA